VKACIVARPGKVFVGADYSQLEPRVFASLSGDPALKACFASGDDFYSVVGAPVFGRYDCSLVKDDKDPNCFAVKYAADRDAAKVVALSSVYGTTAPKMAPAIGRTMDQAQEIIDTYFEQFPDVLKFMLDTHEEVKRNGFVTNSYGRPRRMPAAMDIPAIYGKTPHARLPYEARKMLNLSVNHKCQSTGASIINRCAIKFLNLIKEAGIEGCYLVLNVHDELVVECFEEDQDDVKAILKYAMEETCTLPGVALVAIPVVAKNLRDLK
jgi:DNA polymerase-1